MSQGVFPNELIVAYDLADDRSVFLFHKTLIIFHAWASPCEGQVLLLTIGYHQVIDELCTIIRINAKQRKWEEAPCTLYRGENRFLALIEQGKTFSPTRCDIGHGQGIQEASRKTCPTLHPTMGNQVSLHKAGLGPIPLLESANGNLLFEQGTSPCRGDAMEMVYSRCTQKPISSCRTQRKQLLFALLGQMEIPMPLQRIEQGGQEGDQAFSTFAIIRIPCLHERVHDLGSITRLTWMPNDWLENVLAMIQEPAGVGAVIPCRLGKFIQKHTFVCHWRFAIC